MITHWAVRTHAGGWCSKSINGEKPNPAEDWPGLVGQEFQRVDEPGDDRFEPDGKGDWRKTLETARAERMAEACARRDAALAAGPGELPDTDDEEEIGRHVIRHIGRCHIAHRNTVRRLAAAKTLNAIEGASE